jgi:hypothetical protein
VRIGVLRKQVGDDPHVERLFKPALADLVRARARAGADRLRAPDEMGENEFAVLLTSCARTLRPISRHRRPDIPVRSLDDVIAFNQAHAAEELRWFGQDTFEKSAKATDRAAYETGARGFASARRGRGYRSPAALSNGVAFLVAPTTGPGVADRPRAWRSLRRLDRRGQPRGDRRLSAPLGADGRGRGLPWACRSSAPDGTTRPSCAPARPTSGRAAHRCAVPELGTARISTRPRCTGTGA